MSNVPSKTAAIRWGGLLSTGSVNEEDLLQIQGLSDPQIKAWIDSSGTPWGNLAGQPGPAGPQGVPGLTNVPWVDIQSFGGIPKPSAGISTTTTVNTNSGFPNITVGSALPFFKNGAGVCIWLAGAATAQSTPAAPTITSPVISGTQTLRYQIVGVDQRGGLTAASPIATVSGPAIFSPKSLAISSITATGGVVTVNFASALNTTVTAGMTIHIVGVTGAGASWNGVWTLASAPTTSQVTFLLAGASGTGTVSTSSTGRLSNTAVITAISRDANGVITVTTAQPHNFVVGTAFQPTVAIIENIAIPGAADCDLEGSFPIASTPTANTFTCATGNCIPLTGTIKANGVTTCSTATVWENTWLTLPAISGTTIQYYIYSDSPNPGGPLALIGKTYYPEAHWTDWGPNYGGGFLAPAYVPTTPPSAAQNQMFSTTILSGGGTLNMVLAANVPTSVTGGTIMYDDGPCLAAAIAALPTNLGGQVILSPPQTVGSVTQPQYIFNSPTILQNQEKEIIVASSFIANETIFLGNGGGNWSLQGSSAALLETDPAFARVAAPFITGLGCPMIQFGAIGGQASGLTVDKIYVSCTRSNINGQTGLSVYQGFYVKITNSNFVSGSGSNGGTNIPLLLNNCINVNLQDLTWDGFGAYGNFLPVGQSPRGPLVGNIVIRGSDSSFSADTGISQIFMGGVNNCSGRGVMLDGQFSSDGLQLLFKFDQIWDQATTTPTIMCYGGTWHDVHISNVINDSQPCAVLGNFGLIIGASVKGCLVENPLITGNLISGLDCDLNETVEVGQTIDTIATSYGKGNVGSISTTPPRAVVQSNSKVQSLGDGGAIFAPVLPSEAQVSVVASGVGTFPADTYIFWVTFIGWEGGESAPSQASAPITLNGSQGAQISFTIPVGFKGAFIYAKGSLVGSGERSATIFNSSPQTLTAYGSLPSSGTTVDGTGLPLMNDEGIFTQQLCITNGGAPASSSSTGIPGQVAWDATHIYVCVAVNTWVRASLATF